MREHPEDYVDKCYLRDTYMKTYNHIILPVNGMDLWVRSAQPSILPPRYNRQPGRPRTMRRKGAVEKELSVTKLGRDQRSLRCGKCGVEGHNVTTCHRNLPAKTNKKRGRSGEASNASNSNQQIDAKRPKLSHLERINAAREKAKEMKEKYKKKRDAKKASKAKISTANTRNKGRE